uniref:Gypsy retrotransposon integrase-like protein 1 n=1 Tax=Sphaeramia orbicularis TaxID=375764 RepID=A0A673CDC6_9TELE
MVGTTGSSIHLLSTMEQRTTFEQLLENHISSLCPSRKDKFLLSEDQYQKIIAALTLEKGQKCADGAKFKHWSHSNFETQIIGNKTVLFCKKTANPVITKDDLYTTIHQCHERIGHCGRHKTWDDVKKNYAFIPRVAVEIYLQTCLTCNTRQPVKQPKSAKPIFSLGFLTRVQVDLIDMTSRPDGDFKWILHARDHYSKFSWAFPLTSKRAAEVAEKLVMLFSMFGPPRILQSDNGREFVAAIITEITTLWPGMLIIHGRPRYPQSQGCVERGNGDLQLKLGKWLEEHDVTWSTALQFVTHAINTSTASATGKTPYEVVFGQAPHQDCFLLQQLAEQGSLEEEDIDPALSEPESKVQDVKPEPQEVLLEPQEAQQEPQEALSNGIEEPQTSARALLDMLSSASSSSSQTTEFQQDEVPSLYQSTATAVSSGPSSVKRSHEYYLLHQANIVAEGFKITNCNTLHGSTFDKDSHTIIQITNVFDDSFIPEKHNPQEEPLQEGQYVLWSLDSLADTDSSDSPHSRVRREATASYLQTAQRQNQRHTKQTQQLKDYSVGATVGIRINNADRTNTDARVLPCKVLQKDTSSSKSTVLLELLTCPSLQLTW